MRPRHWLTLFWGCLFSISALPAADWQWQNPLPQGNTLYSLWAFSGQAAIFAGANGSIVRTTDAGDHWSVANGVNGYVGDLRAIAFADVQTGYTGGDGGKLFYTHDGGESWTAGTAPFGQRTIFALTTVSAQKAFAVGDSGLVARTENSGVTWVVLPSGTRQSLHAISFLNDHEGWAAGDSGIVIHTTNAGLSWERQHTGFPDSYTGVAFVDSLTGVLCGAPNIIMRTSDGGTSWEDVLFGASLPLEALRVGADQRLYGAGPGGILLSTNGGISWRVKTVEGQSLFYDVAFPDTSNGWVAGIGGRISRTDDGGTTWHSVIKGTTDNISALVVQDQSHFVAAGDNGRIFQSSDGGNTIATSQPAGVNTSWNAINFPTPSHGFVVGDSGKCFRTDDGGGTWTRMTTPTTNRLSSISFSTDSIGWIGGDRVLFLTTDGGASWIDKTLPDTAYSIAVAIFSDDRSGVILVNRLDGRKTRLLHTADGGLSWSGRNTASTGAVTSVCFIDSALGWAVGNGNTLFYTIDGGASWVTGRLPLNKLYNDIYFISENIGWASSADGYLLKTTDGGSVWSELGISGTSHITRIGFADANTGWVVGPFGMILKTTDGGGIGTPFPPSGPPPVRRPAPKEMSNYPNPALSSTYLPFDNFVAGDVNVQVLGLDGRILRNLMHSLLPAGQYRIPGKAPEWNGCRDDGMRVSSGMYFYRIVTPAKTIYGKLIYLH